MPLHFLKEDGGGCRFGCVAGGVCREDFDEVFAEVGVNDARPAGTKDPVLQAAIHIDVVTDVGLGVEVVGGLPPGHLGLGATVTKTVREYAGRYAGRCGVSGIGGERSE